MNMLTAMILSPIGLLIIALAVVLLLLIVAYTLFLARQRREDILVYLYKEHYDHAFRQAAEIKMNYPPVADFFGRRAATILSDGRTAECLIPPPELSTEEIVHRFRRMESEMAHIPSSPFTAWTWKWDGKAFILVQEGMKGGSTNQTDAEALLLSVAHALRHLHVLKTGEGERFYHGFLLPRSLEVSGNDVVITDACLAFALGPELMLKMLKKVMDGILPMDQKLAEELRQQTRMLSPEQRHHSRLAEVGPQADFYAFGALAALLFTGEPFIDQAHVSWEKVPVRWRPLVKQCLKDNPSDRPHDFCEIEEWLADPEYAVRRHVVLPPSHTDKIIHWFQHLSLT